MPTTGRIGTGWSTTPATRWYRPPRFQPTVRLRRVNNAMSQDRVEPGCPEHARHNLLVEQVNALSCPGTPAQSQYGAAGVAFYGPPESRLALFELTARSPIRTCPRPATISTAIRPRGPTPSGSGGAARRRTRLISASRCGVTRSRTMPGQETIWLPLGPRPRERLRHWAAGSGPGNRRVAMPFGPAERPLGGRRRPAVLRRLLGNAASGTRCRRIRHGLRLVGRLPRLEHYGLRLAAGNRHESARPDQGQGGILPARQQVMVTGAACQ